MIDQPNFLNPAQLLNKLFEDPFSTALTLGILASIVVLALFLVFKLRKKKHSPELPAQDRSPRGQSTASPVSPQQQGLGDSVVQEIKAQDHSSWLASLHQGLSKTRVSLRNSLASLFSGKTALDQQLLEQVHETLFRADIGVSTADKLVEQLRHEFKNTPPTWEGVERSLHAQTLAILQAHQQPLLAPSSPPQVILIVGVNGVGKTTTIGKLAAHFLAAGKPSLLCAADTYRAAAIDQLKVWGERLGLKVIAQQQGSDPAAVAYDAVKAALARQSEVLLIDTAGRLHNKNDLMAELAKIKRVIGKELAQAPHETWLVIDATTGQNAMQQVKAFSEVVNLTGLIVTKLDGTAKGGVLIGICDQFPLPVRFIGVGEKASDLRPFEAREFADSLFTSAEQSS